MSVSREETLRIAQLAELHVDDEQATALAEELSRILDYVAQLAAVPASEQAKPFAPGPDQIALRADEARPWPLAIPPGKLAPAFKEGFFVVPRLGAFERDDVAEDEA